MKLLHTALLLVSVLCCALSVDAGQTVMHTLQSALLSENPGQLMIVPNPIKLYRTKSHGLHIQGVNFPELESKDAVHLKFEPPLVQGVDFVVRTADQGRVSVSLLSGRAWRLDTGLLLLKSLSFSLKDGLVSTYTAEGKGIQVAKVIADGKEKSAHHVSLYSSEARVYQSALQQSITITGNDFAYDLSLLLDPPLEVNVDYTLNVTSPTSAVLNLLPGKRWRSEPGALCAREATRVNAEHSVARADCTRVAEVFADPAVYYATAASANDAGVERYKVFNFDNSKITDVKLALDSAVVGTLRIVSVLDFHMMIVEVRLDASVESASGRPLFTIDTGAGRVPPTMSVMTANSTAFLDDSETGDDVLGE